MALHLVGQDLFLRLVAMFKELLYHVIAKHIGHQLQGVRLDFPEDLFFLVAVRRLQLLLNETRAMLIATKFNNMVVDVLMSVSEMKVTSDPPAMKPKRSNFTFSSYRLFPLLLLLNSSRRALRTT